MTVRFDSDTIPPSYEHHDRWDEAEAFPATYESQDTFSLYDRGHEGRWLDQGNDAEVVVSVTTQQHDVDTPEYPEDFESVGYGSSGVSD